MRRHPRGIVGSADARSNGLTTPKPKQATSSVPRHAEPAPPAAVSAAPSRGPTQGLHAAPHPMPIATARGMGERGNHRTGRHSRWSQPRRELSLAAASTSRIAPAMCWRRDDDTPRGPAEPTNEPSIANVATALAANVATRTARRDPLAPSARTPRVTRDERQHTRAQRTGDPGAEQRHRDDERAHTVALALAGSTPSRARIASSVASYPPSPMCCRRNRPERS